MVFRMTLNSKDKATCKSEKEKGTEDRKTVLYVPLKALFSTFEHKAIFSPVLAATNFIASPGVCMFSTKGRRKKTPRKTICLM